MKSLLLCCVLLSGCSLTLGAAIHPSTDKLDNLDNPVGMIKVESREYNGISGYYEHISSIPDMKDRPGTNMFGVQVKFGDK